MKKANKAKRAKGLLPVVNTPVLSRAEAIASIPRGGAGKHSGQFAKGYAPQTLGLGTKKGGPGAGRRRVLDLFDRIINEAGHQEMLELEIRAFIEKHGMMTFYREYIFPLIPKEMVMTNIDAGKLPTAVNFNFVPRALDVIEVD
jgi:hypothetical protein